MSCLTTLERRQSTSGTVNWEFPTESCRIIRVGLEESLHQQEDCNIYRSLVVSLSVCVSVCLCCSLLLLGVGMCHDFAPWVPRLELLIIKGGLEESTSASCNIYRSLVASLSVCVCVCLFVPFEGKYDREVTVWWQLGVPHWGLSIIQVS